MSCQTEVTPRIALEVPGLPVAQPRQRHRAVVTKDGRVWVQNYTPAKSPVNDWKAAVRLAAARSWGRAPADGPVRLSLEFRFPRPKCRIWKIKPMPAYPHTGRPDIENLAKAVMDALTGVIWRDDAQVAELVTRKLVCAGGQSPGVTIVAEAMGDGMGGG